MTLGHDFDADRSSWLLVLDAGVDACDLDSPPLDCGSRRLSSLTVLMRRGCCCGCDD